MSWILQVLLILIRLIVDFIHFPGDEDQTPLSTRTKDTMRLDYRFSL